MSERRLIGIDLAWSEGNCSGCAELVYEDGELVLNRLNLICETDDIVKWIAPERGNWTVAIDAPLVVCRDRGSRDADRAVSSRYVTKHAGARPASRRSLAQYGLEPRGPELVNALAALAKRPNAAFVEDTDGIDGPRVVFETYPHPATIELFCRGCIIKYKTGDVATRQAGQTGLVKEIRQHLGGKGAELPLGRNKVLDNLLREPNPKLKTTALKAREDKLDALLCAYVAAWAAAGERIEGFGTPGDGVILLPQRNCPDS